MPELSRTYSRLILLVILACGLWLRLFHLPDLSLGNDDLGILLKVQTSSLAELLDSAMADKASPGGGLLFWWCWTGLFGQAEWVLWIPGLMSGMVAIWQLWLLGRKMTSDTAALLAAALLATTEYGIFYSLSLRPYMLAINVLLALGQLLMRFRQGDKPLTWTTWLPAALLLALSGYLHYMAFLIAGLMMASTGIGLPLRHRKSFWMALGGGLLLYAPHLGTLFHHSREVGDTWMAVPGENFFVRFAGYLSHYSWWLAAAVLVVLIWAIARGGLNKSNTTYRLLLLDWVLLPFSILVAYSWLVTPVLHFGVLVLLYPFFLLLLWSFVLRLPALDSAVSVAVLLVVAGSTLIWQRGYYEWNYSRGAEFLVKEFDAENHGQKAGWMQVNHPFYLRYYEEEMHTSHRVNSYSIPDLDSLAAWADTTSATEVAAGWLSRDFPLEAVPLIERYFPYRTVTDCRAISEYMEWSRVAPDSLPEPSRILLQAGQVCFRQPDLFVATESVNPYDYFTEYPEIISVEGDVQLDSIGEGLPKIVMSIEVNGEPRFWQSADLHLRPGTTDQYWGDLAFRTRHLKALQNPMALLKIYLWNPGGSVGCIGRLELRRRPGNPWLYAFVEGVDLSP